MLEEDHGYADYPVVPPCERCGAEITLWTYRDFRKMAHLCTKPPLQVEKVHTFRGPNFQAAFAELK